LQTGRKGLFQKKKKLNVMRLPQEPSTRICIIKLGRRVLPMERRIEKKKNYLPRKKGGNNQAPSFDEGRKKSLKYHRYYKQTTTGRAVCRRKKKEKERRWCDSPRKGECLSERDVGEQFSFLIIAEGAGKNTTAGCWPTRQKEKKGGANKVLLLIREKKLEDRSSEAKKYKVRGCPRSPTGVGRG